MGRVSGPCRHLTCCPQVLCDFPHTAGAVPPDYLLDLIPPLRPRAFSIASSLQVSTAGGAQAAFLEMRQAPPPGTPKCGVLAWHLPSLPPEGASGCGGQTSHPPASPQVLPSRLQILVAVVQYQTRLKEPRRGLCSTWLASLDPTQGEPCSGHSARAVPCCTLDGLT